MSGRRSASRAVKTVATALLGSLAMLPGAVSAAQAVQTFGPGEVSCQPLVGAQLDCLLAAARITGHANVVSFDIGLLPARDRALFRGWCLAGTDACTVTVTGRRVSPQSTRLSVVTSIHWTRLNAPGDDAAARAVDPRPATR